MIKKHHPYDRAERRYIKAKRDMLKRFKKEHGDGLRRQVDQEEEVVERLTPSVQTSDGN